MRVSGGRCASWGCGTRKRTLYATEQDRPDVAIAREIWRAAQAGLDFTTLVFVDETGTTTSMTRLYRPAASWSATTCRPIRSPASANASRMRAWACSTFRPWPSPGQALQPRLQPHRAGLRQTQGAASARRHALVRRHRRRAQAHPPMLPSHRMRQLPPPLRLRANMKEPESR